ncbi:MAG: hypothetical protein LBK82_12360 [Planctomycetaceae bacterium]|jgi:hypothetical protein|nr:hypothetical protein [Planctomycetaceae bacterium]
MRLESRTSLTNKLWDYERAIAELSLQFLELRELLESGALDSCLREYIVGMYEHVEIRELCNWYNKGFEDNVLALAHKASVRSEKERKERFKLIKEELLRKEREHE